jgi:negative regulator of flagellin synthesis FlgM
MNIQNDLQGLQQIFGPADFSGASKQPAIQDSAGTSSANDEAHVSATAYLVTQAVTVPDVRIEKVASVQAALANGSYQVNSTDVAGKLIDSMQSNQK